MTAIIRFIATYARWFYLAGGVGLVVLLVSLLRAQRSIKQALFGLELELAVARRQRAIRLMLLTAAVLATIFVISTIVAPSMPAQTIIIQTATPDLFATPPPTFTNITPTATPTATPTVPGQETTPQPAGSTSPGEQPAGTEEPTPTALPEPVEGPGAVCAITSPADGSTVSGEITFVGTAAGDEFQFYKLEASGPETGGAWASILGDVVSNPVQNGNLGTVNFGAWTAGGYTIRLTIVDTTSNEIATCFISLELGP